VIIDDNGMGSCVGDYDTDGDLDWFVSSIYFPDFPPHKVGNRLYVNDGHGVLTDGTAAAGVADGSWGWGASFQDFNNDGWLDIYHVNGWRPAYPYDESRLFVNGGDGTFTELAAALGCADRGEGRGVCCFDYDRDGDVDIFIANNDQPAVLYRNEGITNHWLTVKLAGASPNTQELGARVRVTAGGLTQLREVNNGSNFLSQDPADAHFGLGGSAVVDVVEVTWTDGTVTVLTGVEADRILTVDRATGSASRFPARSAGGVALLGAAPNPFRESTAIRFSMEAGDPVTVRVYDAAGRLVRSLQDESCAAGSRSVMWDGRNAAGRPVTAGVYWYRVGAGDTVVQGRVARLR
jgi:hypothetical protein